MKFLKDPIWTFVGVIIAVLALVTTIIIFIINKPQRGLRVEVLSNSPLISINSDISTDISVLYKNKPIESLSLILLKIQNTGNTPIKDTDYAEPIRIRLSPPSDIAEVAVQETNPTGINLSPIITSPNTVELTKALLNPGDQIVIRLLVINSDGSVDIGGRISDIKAIEVVSGLQSSQTNQQVSNWFPIFLIFVLPIIFILMVILWNSRRVIEWRIQKYGYDPARDSYITAQEYMLKEPTLEHVNHAIYMLGTAFSWDHNYINKAQEDPLFEKLHKYERYQKIIEKYKEH